ncbi:uncharacterized protein LOC135393331 [Ornithodoros turicata]|uniref:uncharacterized protein LOC135393331 n=1 Tax=Ornithodoros turicata TaxID=34597 RepID=UPI0031386606
MWTRHFIYRMSADKLCRLLHNVAEVLFLAGCFWMGLLVLACVLVNRPIYERVNAFLVGLLLLVPAPLLVVGERALACCSQSTRLDEDDPLPVIPSPRRRRETRRSSPPRSPVLPFEYEDVHWWADRPPTYEEALRLPKLEDMAPAIHQAGRSIA